MNKAIFKYTVTILLGTLCFTTQAIDVTIKSDDSDAKATAEFKKLLKEGGTITFEKGSWTIHLPKNVAKAKADFTINGANKIGSDETVMGAYEDKKLIKTTIAFTGSPIEITKTCKNVSISNIKWDQAGLRGERFHEPVLNLENVFFDCKNWTARHWAKVVLSMPDGCSGKISHVSFKSYGYSGLWLNRSVAKGVYPTVSRGKLIIDRCYFEPDEKSKRGQSSALSHDAGNDEYAPTWNHNGTVVSNSKFVDTRFSISKGSNMIFTNNIMICELSKKEPFHLEEFTNNIDVTNNRFIFKGDKAFQVMSLGATATCFDINITGNVIENNGKLERFISASGAHNITINSNKIINPVPGTEYVTFWGCNNTDIKIGTDGNPQPGIDGAYSKVSNTKCKQVIESGTYFIQWESGEYLALVDGVVKFLKSKKLPTSDQFKWKISYDYSSKLGSYYLIQNQNKDKFYLEVYKGPTKPEQDANLGKPYVLFEEFVLVEAKGDYRDLERAPGFSIHQKDGKYALLPGGNERKSQIIKNNDQAIVSIVKNHKDSNYQWVLNKVE
ncbi:right-handed parallel beta-helix repeat-containing protein [Reichenbachiella versicolor]|uniref:hypothetical protein n=1 Tax=Reichenbachiella versicolor TaxID=1821036 RepID=UPI000D6E10DB|nr:hypothetical protein [Reichenbachiella versicolor]